MAETGGLEVSDVLIVPPKKKNTKHIIIIAVNKF